MGFQRLLLVATGFAACVSGCASPDGQRLVRRIAFGSCAKQDREQPFWEGVLATEPDLFLFLGDNIYADTEDMAVMRAEYAKLLAMPGYRKLRATCPLLATWDDHDYGVNDGGAKYPGKVESQRVFLETFEEPADSVRWRRPGVYDAHVFGPPGKRVQVILLDTRYFRGPLEQRKPSFPAPGRYVPNRDTSVTLLGAKQWEWLERQLRIEAEVRIIASSIQVVSENHGWEKWMNLPHERERLFELIRRTEANGVLFISGDRHFAELSMMDGGVGYSLYDLTSSGLNCGMRFWRAMEKNEHRVGRPVLVNNFATIEIDWSSADPRIDLRIRDQTGGIAFQHRVNLSTLRPHASSRGTQGR